MRASTLINDLQAFIAEHGDAEVIFETEDREIPVDGVYLSRVENEEGVLEKVASLRDALGFMY